ncbi:RHS repeat-associated core domain-containing protein [Microbulbifer sp. TYP-18]|uniref:RHS repeat-associated core domain-containing protein n=1 Tax=Microbulbifer sp. TYP-18 TaxID=3230024 RepID=UPI0034C5BEDF
MTQQQLEDLLAAQGLTTRRGYTGHEHLDRTGLIHMNGRIYDPTLGRFLSPDPLVQAPTFSQSWNRYSYAFNNPVGFTDPTGFVTEEDDEVHLDGGGGGDVGGESVEGVEVTDKSERSPFTSRGGGGWREISPTNLSTLTNGGPSNSTGERYRYVSQTSSASSSDSSSDDAGSEDDTEDSKVSPAGTPYDEEVVVRGNSKTQEGGGRFFRGVGSFFRGLYRYTRHENRILGGAGAGEAVQANTVEHMLLGEALGIALHTNQTQIKEGGNKLLESGEIIAGRQLTGLLSGVAIGGAGAGPSFGIVAGMGDVYYGIESLASELNLNVSTVDYNRPILPQISDTMVRGYAERRLGNLVNTFLSGQD